MKCYICKKQISSGVRHYLPARNHREKDRFRDFCDACYRAQMAKEGYTSNPINTWIKEVISWHKSSRNSIS
jgi:hypothetical protein